jgi:phosphohistidine phosphatase SixA
MKQRNTNLPILLLACLFAFLAGPDAVQADNPAEARQAIWTALNSGRAFAMMRHATAPGTGDPSGYSLDDCATQRNLSDTGRNEARATGAAYRANGIRDAEVLSSAWCRCRETAELLGLGPVRPFAPLNSFFDTPSQGERQTTELRDWLAARNAGKPLVLVTHQVNVTALTGVYPRSGEVVVARMNPDGTVTVLGSLPPPP